MNKVNLIVIAVALFLSRPSVASLGGDQNSIDADRAAFSGTRISFEQPLYDVHQITTKSGVIKEYVSKSGTVFGVSWKGRIHPDLTILLGSYFQEFSGLEASQGHRKGRAPLSYSDSQLHVEKSGHMRDVRGSAYDPTLIPAGVDAGIVQ